MKKEIICLIGCIINFLSAICGAIAFAFFPKIQDVITLYIEQIIVVEIIFFVSCLAIGAGIFKMDIDRMFLKYETDGVKPYERAIMTGVFFICVAIVFYQLYMGYTFNSRGTDMTSYELTHYVHIPALVLGNIVVGSACFLSFQYYRFIQRGDFDG